ncbi:MAG: hypothetical protein IPM54_25415 [Polyangiaceae bacterium]|nr:hypothetical protein [Polyangiaceae bacterium]
MRCARGACKPPTTWTVGSSACIGNDVWTNFDPPAGWDGSCASNTAIAEGILCGGKPCVASINISPPVIEEAPCVAHANVPHRFSEGEGGRTMHLQKVSHVLEIHGLNARQRASGAYRR